MGLCHRVHCMFYKSSVMNGQEALLEQSLLQEVGSCRAAQPLWLLCDIKFSRVVACPWGCIAGVWHADLPISSVSLDGKSISSSGAPFRFDCMPTLEALLPTPGPP